MGQERGECLGWGSVRLQGKRVLGGCSGAPSPRCWCPLLTDFFIVIMMVLDFVLPLLTYPGHTTHGNAVSLFRVLRVFKGVRAVRILRLLLTLRSVPGGHGG